MGFFSPSSWDSCIKKEKHFASCGECGLKKTCFSPCMKPTGKGRKKILFVAEAPGETEDRQGIQLIGKAGQCLRTNLKKIGEDLDDAWKTNAVICRPPENEMKDVYIESCQPNLLKTIETLKPNVIILLGMSAVKSLISTEWEKDIGNLSRWIGFTIPSKRYNAWICPTIHPSYILRKEKEDEMLNKILRKHLKRAYELESVKPSITDLDALKGQIEIIHEDRLKRLKLRALATSKGVLAFDYETTGLKPERPEQKIISCSFCLDGQTCAMMMNETLHPLLKKVLLNPDLKKVASNLKFEHRWSIRKLGIEVANWYWDTMLAAHIIDNREGITSIKFQSFVLFGINDYDSKILPYLQATYSNDLNRITELDPNDLLIYNGLDSLLEYKVMELQRATIYQRSE